MKTLKTTITIIVTFILAFLISGLYEFEFFSGNLVRYILLLLLIVLVLAIGFFMVKSDYTDGANGKQKQ